MKNLDSSIFIKISEGQAGLDDDGNSVFKNREELEKEKEAKEREGTGSASEGGKEDEQMFIEEF